MTLFAAVRTEVARTAARPFAIALAAPRHPNQLIHLALSFGLIGVLLVSIVDSSFVPLPIPGITDVMIVVMAAQHANLFLLVGAATLGSFLGGLFSYQVGQSPRASSRPFATGWRPTPSSRSRCPPFCLRPCRSRPLCWPPER